VPRLAPKICALAALIVLTLPACSNSSTNKSLSTAPSTGNLPVPSATASGSPSPSAPASPSGTASGSPSPSGGAAPGAVAGTQIVISKFIYSPVNLMVKPGATVTVMNQDPIAHTLTASSTGGGIPFDTGNIDGGATGHFTAPTTPGSYPYICIYHSNMHGTLTVAA
jgi:plastocyanin